MKSKKRLLKLLEDPPRMARGRLGILSRGTKGGTFYHLQYRKDTKLFQRYVPRDEAPAYEKATEQYRAFMEAVDAFVDEISARTAKEIKEEAARERRKRLAPKG